MIKDIEEESKTKFSIKVEFSFSFKALNLNEKSACNSDLAVVIYTTVTAKTVTA